MFPAGSALCGRGGQTQESVQAQGPRWARKDSSGDPGEDAAGPREGTSLGGMRVARGGLRSARREAPGGAGPGSREARGLALKTHLFLEGHVEPPGAPHGRRELGKPAFLRQPPPWLPMEGAGLLLTLVPTLTTLLYAQATRSGTMSRRLGGCLSQDQRGLAWAGKPSSSFKPHLWSPWLAPPAFPTSPSSLSSEAVEALPTNSACCRLLQVHGATHACMLSRFSHIRLFAML